MGVRLTFLTALTASFVLAFGLSVFQRLLVLVGGILGAGISYSCVGISKRAQRSHAKYIDFDVARLVSVNDKSLQCVFLKDSRCRKLIKGKFQHEFYLLRRDVCSCQAHLLHQHLRRMVMLKLCGKCSNHLHIEKCINKYIEKWSAELEYELDTQVSPGEPLTPRAEPEQDLPGTYLDSPPPDPSLYGNPRGRRTSSHEPNRVYDPETQPARIATDNPAPNTIQITLLDPSPLNAQQAPSPLVLTARPTESPSSAEPSSATPGTSTDGWYLQRYQTGKKETLHDKIFEPLQKGEIKSGFIYILRREDDEEYYKVGFSTNDVNIRLENQNMNCNGNWEVVWSTKTLVKHAKRVERLIHLECEARRLRYREVWCKTGGRKCAGQHREIVKATYKEVSRCVKYWVRWMTRCDRYEESFNDRLTSPGRRRRISSGAEPVPVWILKAFLSAKTNDPTDEFCLMSTGETWVQSPCQRKCKTRSKSTSALATTPTRRPAVTRGTQSARSLAQTTLQSDNTLQVPEVETPSRRRAGSMGRSLDVELQVRRDGGGLSVVRNDDEGEDTEVMDVEGHSKHHACPLNLV